MTPQALIFRSLLLTSALPVMLTSCGNKEKERSGPPNVIIIYSDDQGTLDANCYGSADLYTPNIDRLAENGLRFTQFYAASSICSPSRASLLTGKTPLAAGLPENGPAHYGDKGMPTEKVTIAETLKEHGYVTGHVGKWHLGYSDETMPNGQGFDHSFGFMGGCIDNYSHFFYWGGPNIHDLWEDNKEVWRDGEYFQDLIQDQAKKFIEDNRDTTFFLYYAVNMPHYPLQGRGKWREYYKDLDSPRNMYAAAVSTVDEEVGGLLKVLEDNDLLDNTIIIFQSDQGHSHEVRTFGGGGNAGPYRGAKFSFFEGGVRIPAIISWPGKIAANETRDQACINMDWFPTILDLCGFAYDENAFEGKSIKGVIMENETTPHDRLIWYQRDNYWAVRIGDWKLLKNPYDPANKAPITEQDSLFLTNVVEDPGELVNLAFKYPKKVKELQNAYDDWYTGIMNSK